MSCASAAAVAVRPKQSIAVPIVRFMVNSAAGVCLARASTNAYEARSPLVRHTIPALISAISASPRALRSARTDSSARVLAGRGDGRLDVFVGVGDDELDESRPEGLGL